MPKRRRKHKRRRGGRRPALTEQQKNQIRKIAQTEIETAFRRMLGSIGVQRRRRQPRGLSSRSLRTVGSNVPPCVGLEA